MASREPQKTACGTDGSDHAYRQRVAAHYQVSALNKSRLKSCIFFHYLLTFAMFAKLAPYMLDRFNFFILAIEELEVPEPLMWEWFWVTSITASLFLLDAVKKNSIVSLRNYMIGIILFGYLPCVYAILYWFPDVWVFLFSEDDHDRMDIVYWKGYPYGLLWYAFILLALQVHSFSMYFCYCLVAALRSRGARKIE